MKAVPRDQNHSLDTYKRSATFEATTHGNKPLKNMQFFPGGVHDFSTQANRIQTWSSEHVQPVEMRPGSPPRVKIENFNPPQNNKAVVSLIEAVGIDGENVMAATEHLQRELKEQRTLLDELNAQLQAEEIRADEMEKLVLSERTRSNKALEDQKEIRRLTNRLRNENLQNETRNSGLKLQVQGSQGIVEAIRQSTEAVRSERQEETAVLHKEEAFFLDTRKSLQTEEASRSELLEKVRELERQRGVVHAKLRVAEKKEEHVTKSVVDALVVVRQPLRDSLAGIKVKGTPGFK